MLKLSKATEYMPKAVIRLSQPAKITGTGIYSIKDNSIKERGAYEVDLSAQSTTLVTISK